MGFFGRKKTALMLFALFLTGAVIFALRGPYVSNFFKKRLLSELETAIGRQVTAQLIYVNMFPLFVEAKGVKVFDKNGIRVFAAEGVKGYVKLSGILKGKIEIERVALKSPELWAERAQAEEMSENLRRYRAREKRKVLDISVRAVVVNNGGISYYDEKNNAILTVEGLEAEIILRDEPSVTVSARKLAAAYGAWPLFTGQIRGAAVIGKEAVSIKRLTLTSDGSSAEGAGSYLAGKGGSFEVEINVLVDTIKRLFGLKTPGQGSIQAKGNVKILKEVMDTTVDLKVKGDFYLETLMELLKAHIEQSLDGLISFEGLLSGKLSDLRGSASARLKKGSIFDVKVDELKCDVAYAKKVLSFKKGRGRLYGGRALMEASITLPEVRPYYVNVSFSEADSDKALNLIHMSWLPIPKGKVTGTFITKGREFAPHGRVSYRAVEQGKDILGRVKEAQGDYAFDGDVVVLTGFEAKTEASVAPFEGEADITTKTMRFAGSLATSDLKDLTAPYFTMLAGQGQAEWSATGSFDDPLIEGRLTLSDASLEDYSLGGVQGEVVYRKNLLLVKSLRAEKTLDALSGSVWFPRAEFLFDVRSPDYKLAAAIKGADLNGVLSFFGFDAPVTGSADSVLDITGTAPAFSGTVKASGVSAYEVTGIEGEMDFLYDGAVFTVKDAKAVKNGRSLSVRGRLSRDGGFDFKASSEMLYLGDLTPRRLPVNYRVALKADGRGTLKNPEVKAEAVLSEGNFRGRDIGGGNLKALINGKEALIEAKVFDGKAAVKGKARLEGEIPWSAEVAVGRGRYDFLIGAFLADAPDDLLVDIEGKASASGDRKHFKGSAALSRLHVNLFGQGFTNESDIKFTFADGTIDVSELAMRSGDASFRLKGLIEPGVSLNAVVDGNLSLAPLRALSKKIDIIKGSADFVFTVKGGWDKPSINGGINVSNSSLAVKDFPQRFSSINGYLYVDDNRVVIQRLGAVSGGGEIELTGLIHLDGLKIEKLYVDALINDVTAYVSKDFVVNFGGNVLFRGTPDSQYVTGEVRINRARYKERLEWKSWLLTTRPRKAPEVEKSWAKKVSLNLKLYGTENIIIDNNIARAPMKIDLTLRGTVGSPVILGRLETTEGKVFFRNREFRILNATADYIDPQKAGPYIAIVAETNVRGYHIWMNLEGRAEQFDLSLTSDPPVDEVKILSLLTVGELGENLKGLEGGIGAAEATSFLTGKFQDVVEERLRDITGLSRVQIAPYVSPSTGTVTPRITVAKTLIEDKLFVTYSTAVGVTGDELKLEYLLGRNTSLLGERDERGSVGGDIKFRFQFK